MSSKRPKNNSFCFSNKKYLNIINKLKGDKNSIR